MSSVSQIHPLQLKFPFTLRTAAMALQFIAKRFGVHLCHGSVRRLLAQMGMSAQRLEAQILFAVFLEFLRRLMVNASAPIFLIVDGHPIHGAKSVKGYVEAQNGRLGLHYVPSYSPELKP